MKRSKILLLPLTAAAMLLLVPAASAQSKPPLPNSAVNSPSSAIHADERSDQLVINACAAAANELKASRSLIETLEVESVALKKRLETERQLSSMLAELNDSRKAENAALNSALAAKNETIAAKDTAIESQQKLIDALAKRKSSVWRRIGDVLIGIAAAAIIK